PYPPQHRDRYKYNKAKYDHHEARENKDRHFPGNPSRSNGYTRGQVRYFSWTHKIPAHILLSNLNIVPFIQKAVEGTILGQHFHRNWGKSVPLRVVTLHAKCPENSYTSLLPFLESAYLAAQRRSINL